MFVPSLQRGDVYAIGNWHTQLVGAWSEVAG